MNINETKLFDTIHDYIKAIDSELMTINNTGIFFAPELFLAFGMGLEIMKQKDLIFNEKNILWEREEDLKNGGPTDIIFRKIQGENKELVAVMELKLRNNYAAYKADIDKLLRLSNTKCKKYFCVLLDSFTDKNDERLNKLEDEYKGEIIRIKNKSFKTNQNWYKREIYCVLNLYRVENKKDNR